MRKSFIYLFDYSADETQENEPITEETSAAESLPPPPTPATPSAVPSKPPVASVSSETSLSSSSRGSLATPAVRKIAKENNVRYELTQPTKVLLLLFYYSMGHVNCFIFDVKI